ncbi:MAG: hypothetical protein ACJ763_00450 [Bdellovibrionia bacterium]
MPYLNWKNAQNTQLNQEVLTAGASGSSREFQLILKLSGELLQELIPLLQDIYEQGGPELRIDLPREWIMFWKSRPGDSRLLMAHPQPEEWVSTMALGVPHGKRVIEALQKLGVGETVSLEKLGTTGSQTTGQTNVEVLITRI